MVAALRSSGAAGLQRQSNAFSREPEAEHTGNVCVLCFLLHAHTASP